MRFRDLLGKHTPRQVGRITVAEWDAARHGIGFEVVFEPSGRRLKGHCAAGLDPVSGVFVSESDLKSKVKQLRDLKVYENQLGGDPNTMSAEDFRHLQIEFSLKNLGVSYRAVRTEASVNTFLARAMRK